MNRRKKVNSILKKRAKKANNKANPKNKTPYVSKAKRAETEEKTDPKHD